jgi:outer membrane protein TolC
LLGTLGCALPPAFEQPSPARSAGPASSQPPAEEPLTVTLQKPVFEDPPTERRPNSEQPARDAEKSPTPPTTPLLSSGPPPRDRYAIDLASALRLAGASNLQIALTVERIQQAQARLQAAKVTWLPSLDAGLGYNKHDGRIQDTRGQVIEVSRNSLFVGGGPSVGTFGVPGASTQPRLTVGLSLADALFAPLAERQVVKAAQAAAAATFNDTLLQVALAYLDLLYAQGQVAIAQEVIRHAQELDRLVSSRVRAGTALPADGFRARAELADRRRQLFQAEQAVRVASAELVRLIRLDPSITLFPLEDQPCPIVLVDTHLPLPDLIAQGLSHRPELAQQQALVHATLARLRQERWRPWQL